MAFNKTDTLFILQLYPCENDTYQANSFSSTLRWSCLFGTVPPEIPKGIAFFLLTLLFIFILVSNRHFRYYQVVEDS